MAPRILVAIAKLFGKQFPSLAEKAGARTFVCWLFAAAFEADKQ